jgi:copper chaperone CopZ
MNEPDAPTSETAALELVDAEITVVGLDSPKDEQALTAALSGLDGIRDFSISKGIVAIEYDPVRINQHHIGEVIEHAGYRVGSAETAIASPIGDALHD